MTSAFSWQNSISLCPASFCTLRPNLPVTPSFIYVCVCVCVCVFLLNFLMNLSHVSLIIRPTRRT